MRINNKVRSKKLNARVDLTAMVSVSFLLIIFFMVTKELSKPNAMSLGLPDNRITCGSYGCSGGTEMRTLTVLLDDNDKMIVYGGLLAYPLENPKEVKYGKEGIRKELFNKNKAVQEYSAKYGRSDRGAIVIIKPSKKCNYKNLVDILDEMAIADIQTYVIVNDYTPDETKLLAAK
jgi:biopolymer transport protein ExbD